MTNLVRIVVVCLVFSTATASASIGELFYIKGKIRINNKLISKRGSKLNVGDIVHTSKSSFAILKLIDNSTIKVNKNSKIIIENIKNEKAPTSIVLKLGSIISEVAKSSSKKVKFEVKRKRVSLGVRGTKFYASLGKNKDLWMCVNEGEVVVTDKAINSKKVPVKKGQGVRVIPGKKISDPKYLPWTDKINFEMNPDKGSVENKTSIEDAYKDLRDQDYD